LYDAGLDPSFMIGGILNNFDSNYRIGKGSYIVIEGDEYDTAFFDKGAKFLHYDPFACIITSIEFDHADIFKDIEHVKKTFKILVSRIKEENKLVAFYNDTNIDEVIESAVCKVMRYGQNHHELRHITDNSILMGDHNLFNAIAAFIVSKQLNLSDEQIIKAISRFKGVKRRQEVRGEKRGITIMDDFAHHPTAVRETIKAVKPFYKNSRIIAVFEPRTNSSMRKVFQDIYPQSFDLADIICIRSPSAIEKVPMEERFSSEKLAEDLKKLGKEAYLFHNTEDIIEFLIKEAKTGDLILVMSNGGFDNIHERLLNSL
ncbi:MAG: UDP-N-acetylmuramate:L-alanyl-gamma-D-glutamyl-meso-diaminopimelate ligase, partial [Desulfobacterales bacterium]|nr:UDP-N-acetylmuramate:L-alanyl-gamma-D-glutamyl-meso-diaminopimelate ligase [Desulfobacterales bacterium]